MNKKIEVIFIILLMALDCSCAYAQSSTTGRIKTEIVSPLMVEESTQMNFGRFVSDMAGGTIVLSPQGDKIAGGNILLLDDPVESAVFIIKGAPGTLVAIKLPEIGVKLYSENGFHTLIVDQFVSDMPPGGKIISDIEGRLEVKIGATLHVGDWQSNPPGFYAGTYDVVFMYN